MTYKSFAVKLLAPAAFIIVLMLFPNVVNSVTTTEPYEKAPEIPPPVVVVKKPVVKKAIVQAPQGDCKVYAPIIEQYDWPVATAMRICAAESSGNPIVINWQDVHKDKKGNIICVS